MKKFLAVILAGALCLGALTACGGDSTSTTAAADGEESTTVAEEVESGDPIKIGVLAPLTGDVSVYGIAAKNGIVMGIDEINAAGGVLGRQIELVILDEKGDISEAVNAYNSLMNQEVVAIIGDVTSKPCMAVAELAAEENMPMITPTGTAAPITTYGPNVFRTCFIDPFQGTIMATYASENLGATTAAIVYNTSDDYSSGLADAFVVQAEAKGITIVAKEGYGAADKDFRTQLTKIAELDPDVVFVPDYYNTDALIATQARELGYDKPLLGGDGWDGVLGVLDEANVSVVNNCFFASHYSPDDTAEQVVNFLSGFEAKFGETPNSFAALGYDTAYIMAEAIKNAGSTDSQAIIDALAATDMSCVTGDITFDEIGDPIKTVSVIELKDGVASLNSKVSLD
ncbi:MAG: ABC transporter substrate-binding protein [Firmicutes bacterium]|nr:ABC transporter substrate-binding protein [Bacillota bacterium]